MQPLLIVTLEGPQGCGKTRAAEIIKRELERAGIRAEIYEAPGKSLVAVTERRG
jgi:thymidylate kinase